MITQDVRDCAEKIFDAQMKWISDGDKACITLEIAQLIQELVDKERETSRKLAAALKLHSPLGIYGEQALAEFEKGEKP